jgi:hypothetical protein
MQRSSQRLASMFLSPDRQICLSNLCAHIFAIRDRYEFNSAEGGVAVESILRVVF